MRFLYVMFFLRNLLRSGATNPCLPLGIELGGLSEGLIGYKRIHISFLLDGSNFFRVIFSALALVHTYFLIEGLYSE